MYNSDHLSFKPTFGFPLVLATPASVFDHVADKIRLISMLPDEWPKLRSIEVLDQSKVLSSVDVDGVHIDFLEIDMQMGNPSHGYLINNKYFFSTHVEVGCGSLVWLFKPFESMGVRPMVRRTWCSDYLPDNPMTYNLVSLDVKEYFSSEWHYEIDIPEDAGITCLADLMAYCYKFEFDVDTKTYKYISDLHEVTKRIRKPWATHLCQREYGEAPHTTADLHKVVSFLVQKCADNDLLSTEEKAALASFTTNGVTIGQLKRIDKRNTRLNEVMEAYNSPQLITRGCEMRSDPINNWMNLHDRPTPK